MKIYSIGQTQVNGLPMYRIINAMTRETHSVHRLLSQALQVARDLNRMTRG